MSTATASAFDHATDATMAKYAHQPIHLSSFTVSFSPTTDNAGISNSSLSKLNSLPYFIDTTENSYRLGPETYVPIPRGESYCQANGNWRYATMMHLATRIVH